MCNDWRKLVNWLVEVVDWLSCACHECLNCVRKVVDGLFEVKWKYQLHKTREVIDWLVEMLSGCEVGDGGWKEVHRELERVSKI